MTAIRQSRLRLPRVIAALSIVLISACSDNGSNPVDNADGPVTVYSWSHRSVAPGVQYQALAAVANGQTVVAIANTNSNNDLLISRDGGREWADGIPLDIQENHGVAYVNGIYFAFGTHQIQYSLDLENWQAAAWSFDDGCRCTLHSLTGNSQYYLAVGPTGAAASQNGTDWIIVNVSVIASDNTWLLESTYYNKEFIAMGTSFDSSRTDFYTAPNLVNWSLKGSIPSTRVKDFAVGPNGAVAVGDFGEVWYSSDLITWQEADSKVASDLNSVIYANQQFMAVGTEGTVIGSRKGIEWVAMPAQTSSTLNDIVWTGRRYVAVGTNILLASE